jgi:hypothetical protein
MKAAVANRVYTNWPGCVTATETCWRDPRGNTAQVSGLGFRAAGGGRPASDIRKTGASWARQWRWNCWGRRAIPWVVQWFSGSLKYWQHDHRHLIEV